MQAGRLPRVTTAAHDDVAALAARAEALSAEKLVREVVDRFGDRVSLACSFQKEESVLRDMLFGIAPKARVFAIDSHYRFPKTYEPWREVERRYAAKDARSEGPGAEQTHA